MSAQSIHCEYGVVYLLSIGYREEDIKLNNRGMADITTINDSKRWEVKYPKGSSEPYRIIFTLDQIRYMSKDTNILIFYSKLLPIRNVDIVKFADILSGKYSRCYVDVQFTLPLVIAKNIFECIDYEYEHNEKYKKKFLNRNIWRKLIEIDPIDIPHFDK